MRASLASPSSIARLACALVLAPLLATGLAACGSTVSTSGFKGESKAVAERISSFQSDLATGSESKLCAADRAGDLAVAVRARLRAAGSDCEQAMKHQLGAIDDYEMSVQQIAVHGAAASAQVKSTWSGKQRLATLLLVREGGAWKVSGLQQ